MHNFTDSTIFTAERLQREVDYFLQQDAFVFDVETWGPHRGVPTQNDVLWIGLATNARAIAVPMGHPNGNVLLHKATRKMDKLTRKYNQIPPVFDSPPAQMTPREAFEILQPLFFGDQTKIAHNATFDLISVAKYFGGNLPTPSYRDTIVLQWLLNENLRTKGLKELVKKYYQHDYDEEQVGRRVEDHPFWKVARYQILDVKYPWYMQKHFMQKIREEGLEGILELEEEILGVLLRMGTTGAVLDEAALTGLDMELSSRIVDVEKEIYKSAGRIFNINSGAQKAEVLFAPKADGGQGLKSRTLTDGGQKAKKMGKELEWSHYSTAAEILEALPSNPVVNKLLEYQELNKLQSTYVKGYLGDPDDPKRESVIFGGRVYTDFVQYGTVTGRFSSRRPNLQNVPSPGTELGKKIRGLFVAPPGHKLIVADYGQIELVMLAHFIEEGALFEGFHKGVDPHSATAAALAGEDPQEFMVKVKADEPSAKKLRSVAKGINFAVIYGAGPDKVASMAGIKLAEAKNFMSIHQRQFPEVYKFKKKVISDCRKQRPPHITTLLGRKRRLPEINYADESLRGRAERQAVNSLIQGSSADLIKLAMVRLDGLLQEHEGMSLSLSVHDELVCIARDEDAEHCAELVKEAMLGEGIQGLITVPLSSDVKIVERWSDAK